MTLAYDKLGRLLTRTVTPSGGPAEVTRSVWDEVRPGFANLGRLAREASPTARVCRDHDLAGRVLAERWTLPADITSACGTDPAGSESFSLSTTYDAGGRPIIRTTRPCAVAPGVRRSKRSTGSLRRASLDRSSPSARASPR